MTTRPGRRPPAAAPGPARCRRVARGASDDPGRELAARRLLDRARGATEPLATDPSEFFARMVASVGVARFERTIWSRRPVRLPRPFSDGELPSLASFVAGLAHAAREPARITLFDSDHRPAPIDPALTLGDRPGRPVDVERLAVYLSRRRLALRVTHVEELDPRVAAVNRALAIALRAHVWTNAYFTPHATKMLPSHWDAHDVFVHQAWGRKRWRVAGQGAIDLPLAGHGPAGMAHLAAPTVFKHRFTLAPGDFAYVPRGFVHEALPVGDGSLHFTFGVRRPSYHAVIERLLHAALDEARGELRFRRSLPIERGDALSIGETARRELDALLARVARSARRRDPGLEVADLLRVDFAGRPGLLGHGERFGAYAELSHPEPLGATEPLARTPSPLRLRARRGSDFVEVDGAGATLLVPREALPFLRSLARRRQVTVGDARAAGLDEQLADEVLRELVFLGVLERGAA